MVLQLVLSHTYRQLMIFGLAHLKLYHTLLMYEAVNPEVSIIAVRVFQRHLWYLTAEMVLLALFSNKVPQEEKRALPDRLLTVKPPEVIHIAM